MAAISGLPIKRGLQANYDLLTPDANTIYITTDTKCIYLGAIKLAENYSPEVVIKDVEYDSTDHVITFTYTDDDTTDIDLPLESVIQDVDYDSDTKELTFTLVSGGTTVISLTDLIDAYYGDETDSAEVNVASDGTITTDVKVSATAGNQIAVETDGLYVPVSAKPITANTVVIGNSAGTDITSSGKEIVTVIEDTTPSTDVTTVSAVLGAMFIGDF